VFKVLQEVSVSCDLIQPLDVCIPFLQTKFLHKVFIL